MGKHAVTRCTYNKLCLLKTPNLKHYSTYSDTELTSCMERMAVLGSKMEGSKHKAVKDKYSSNKFLRISKEASLRGDIIKKLARAEN